MRDVCSSAVKECVVGINFKPYLLNLVTNVYLIAQTPALQYHSCSLTKTDNFVLQNITRSHNRLKFSTSSRLRSIENGTTKPCHNKNERN